jgi:hypothetical protein
MGKPNCLQNGTFLFAKYGTFPLDSYSITIDGHAFDHTLLPSKQGHYFVYNEFISRAAGKKLGDTVHVTLEKDTKKREIIVPAHIENRLNDAGVLDFFNKQPDYIKREQLNHIETAKKDETKSNRLEALIKRLVEQKFM